ncbi:hypothetical protein G3I45_19395, partial [Streptomyces sp. SID339]|nr:hypothetical protein [Streptomyces sp. SID339]
PAEALTALSAAAARGWDTEPWLGDLRHGLYEAALTSTDAADWPTVLAHLAPLPADFRATHLLRRYAEGRLATAAEDWASAAEAFGECVGGGSTDGAGSPPGAAQQPPVDVAGPVAGAPGQGGTVGGVSADAGGSRDVMGDVPGDAGDLRAYARARLCEVRGLWDDALALFGGLAGGFGDVADRVLYARGRAADVRGEWDGVIDGFGRLPDGYADGEVGVRRLYARARLAADQRG